jgi:hypothetical protein
MPYVWVPSRRRRFGMRRRRFGFHRRRRYRSYFSRGRMRSGYRRPYSSFRGRGRYRGRAGRMRRQARLVIQVPGDMLPPRPVAGGWARMRRRARF